MNRMLTLHLWILLWVPIWMACSVPEETNSARSPEEVNDWELSEETGAERHRPSDGEPLDCSSSLQTDWENAGDFAFSMYRELTCRREPSENIVFSPVAIRLALGEWATNAEQARAEPVAEQFGYADAEEMFVDGEQIRTELLDREPTSGVRRKRPREYDIEEDDPERLHRALGIEFYDVDCDPETSGDCRWSPHNNRWCDEELLDNTRAPEARNSSIRTLGTVLRGQWEDTKMTSSITMFSFSSPDGASREVRLIGSTPNRHAEFNGVHLFEWRLIGGDVSIFFVGSPELTIGEIETEFLSRSLGEWLAALRAVDNSTNTSLQLPVFGLEETVDLSRLFEARSPITSTTRLTVDLEEFEESNRHPEGDGSPGRWKESLGINLPDPVDQVSDVDCPAEYCLSSGVGRPYDVYRFDTPFLFFVYDRPTESVVNMGRVSRP